MGVLGLKHFTKVGRIKAFREVLMHTHTVTIQFNNVFLSYMRPELHRLYTVLSILDGIRFTSKFGLSKSSTAVKVLIKYFVYLGT